MADVISIALALDTGPVLAGSKQVAAALHQVETAEKAVQQQTTAVERATQQAAQAMRTESQAARITGQAVQSTAQSTQHLAQQDHALTSAATQASQALHRQQQASQQAGQSTQTLASHARTAQGALASMGASLAALAGATFALSSLKNAFEGMVSAALKVEGLNAAFKAITGSAQGAGEAMQFVRATGERLGVQADAIAGSYKGLLAATQGTTLSLKDTQTLFLGVVEASRALALSSEDTAGALRPLVQIISQGAVQADELRNEFASRIPGSMQLLVTASNGAFKSVGELSKAMEDGKLKGQAALDLMANFGIVLRQRFAPAAEEAARGAAAAFARFQQAVTDLQVAFGTLLLPVLSDVARAWTDMARTATGAANSIGPSFVILVREAASAVTGLAGSVAVLVKVMEFLHSPLNDPAEIAKRWGALKESIGDVATAQNQILNPPNLTRLNPKLPPLPGDYGALRTLTLGGGEDEKKSRGKTDAEKAATQLASEQLSLRKQLNDAYDKALYSERELTDLHLQQAKFSETERAGLLRHYDDTKLLEEDNKLKEDRLALDKTLQEGLDKQLFTERELLQKKMEGLRYGEEEIKIRLKQFDTEKRLREEKEKQVEAEREAVRASEEHVRMVERLMDKLEPQRRRMSRAEQLQGTMSELATETSDPYLLAQADQKRVATLAFEETADQLERLKDLGEQTFQTIGDALTDFVTQGKLDFKGLMDSLTSDLLRFASQTLMNQATRQGGWLESVLNLGLRAVGIAGIGGGGGDVAGVAATSVIPRQHGGPVSAGMPYLVGERGPELYVPRSSGTVLPHGQGMASPTVVNVHVSGVQDAQSFVQSRGAVSRAMMGALSQARQQM